MKNLPSPNDYTVFAVFIIVLATTFSFFINKNEKFPVKGDIVSERNALSYAYIASLNLIPLIIGLLQLKFNYNLNFFVENTIGKSLTVFFIFTYISMPIIIKTKSPKRSALRFNQISSLGVLFFGLSWACLNTTASLLVLSTALAIISLFIIFSKVIWDQWPM